MNEYLCLQKQLDCSTRKISSEFCSDISFKRKQAVKRQLKIMLEEELLIMYIEHLVKYRNIEKESW